MGARVRNAIGPEQPARERPDVEVEIVDLIPTRRVGKDVQSDKPEGCVMLPAVDTNVGALHEPIVGRGKHVSRFTALCVRAQPSPRRSAPAITPRKSVILDGSDRKSVGEGTGGE